MKDEDIPKLLDAAAEPEPASILDAPLHVSRAERGFLVLRDGILIARHRDGDEHIRETLLRYRSSIELKETADRLGLRRKTLGEKKKKGGL